MLLSVLTLDLAMEHQCWPIPVYFTKHHKSPESKVLDWIHGKERVLVASKDQINGFEAEFIIDLTTYTYDQGPILSRASIGSIAGGDLRAIFYSSMASIANQLNETFPNHDCRTIMSKSDRPKFDLHASPATLTEDQKRSFNFLKTQQLIKDSEAKKARSDQEIRDEFLHVINTKSYFRIKQGTDTFDWLLSPTTEKGFNKDPTKKIEITIKYYGDLEIKVEKRYKNLSNSASK